MALVAVRHLYRVTKCIISGCLPGISSQQISDRHDEAFNLEP